MVSNGNKWLASTTIDSKHEELQCDTQEEAHAIENLEHLIVDCALNGEPCTLKEVKLCNDAYARRGYHFRDLLTLENQLAKPEFEY